MYVHIEYPMSYLFYCFHEFCNIVYLTYLTTNMYSCTLSNIVVCRTVKIA